MLLIAAANQRLFKSFHKIKRRICGWLCGGAINEYIVDEYTANDDVMFQYARLSLSARLLRTGL